MTIYRAHIFTYIHITHKHVVVCDGYKHRLVKLHTYIYRGFKYIHTIYIRIYIYVLLLYIYIQQRRIYIYCLRYMYICIIYRMCMYALYLYRYLNSLHTYRWPQQAPRLSRVRRSLFELNNLNKHRSFRNSFNFAPFNDASNAEPTGAKVDRPQRLR